MENDTPPMFISLREVQRRYGISAGAVSQMKHRGRPTPFPLYSVPGIHGLAVRLDELEAFISNLKPVTTAA